MPSGPGTIPIHGTYAQMREAMPGIRQVDALLLGGTGKTHDWTLSRRIVEQTDTLHVGNVRSATEQVRPFAVDVCHGVRMNGHLDERKLAPFLGQVYQGGVY